MSFLSSISPRIDKQIAWISIGDMEIFFMRSKTAKNSRPAIEPSIERKMVKKKVIKKVIDRMIFTRKKTLDVNL